MNHLWRALYEARKYLGLEAPMHASECCWRWLKVQAINTDGSDDGIFFAPGDKRELLYVRCPRHGISSIIPTDQAWASLERIFEAS